MCISSHVYIMQCTNTTSICWLCDMTFCVNQVLLAGSENFTLIGTPLLRFAIVLYPVTDMHIRILVGMISYLMCVCVCSQEAVEVRATVIEHGRTAKVVIFKKKRRKNYKRKRGMTYASCNAQFYEIQCKATQCNSVYECIIMCYSEPIIKYIRR